VDSNRIIKGRICYGGGIASEVALCDVVGSLSTKVQVVATNDSIGGKSRALNAYNQKINKTGRNLQTLNTSREARVWNPDCLIAAFKMAVLAPLSGDKEVERSNLTPSAIWFSTSTTLRRMLEVVQAWVTVKPCFLSVHFASRSAKMASLLVSQLPATLKATFEGVLVLTSREAPWK
jgi:hypothetical protein